MDSDEMIEILEGLILDPEVNGTAKCTIRTLREIQAEQPQKAGEGFADLYELPPSSGPRTIRSKS